jgi:predicted glycosyltransferase
MKRLGGLINEMDNTLKDFPESFENLQAQITSVTDTMKERLQEKNHENKQIAE